MERLSFIASAYLDKYNEKQSITLIKHFDKIKKIGSDAQNFDFYFSNSAVYSSRIEGNIIDFDSYMKFSYSGMNNTGKSFKEIEDLKMAYSFAKENRLNFNNFLKCHEILSNTIVEDDIYKGVIRDKDVYVFANGKKIFSGASKEIVKNEMSKLFEDIEILISSELTINQVFYYASMLHLIMVQIHPFADGNGRCSRLIEKWFLSEKLGENAWFIQSERLYHKRIASYYKNVHLGDNYNNIDYDYSIPFLLMLPMALRLK
jgi:Fic family protein